MNVSQSYCKFFRNLKIYDFIDILANLGLGIIGRVTKWYEGRRFDIVWQFKELATEGSIKVADPAGAQTLLGGCQTEVFYSNGDVNIPMWFAIGTDPFLVMLDGSDDVHGSGVEPVAIVALLQLGSLFSAVDNAELPWLAVYGGRRKAHTLQHIINFLVLNITGQICPTTITSLYQFQEIHIRVF